MDAAAGVRRGEARAFRRSIGLVKATYTSTRAFASVCKQHEICPSRVTRRKRHSEELRQHGAHLRGGRVPTIFLPLKTKTKSSKGGKKTIIPSKGAAEQCYFLCGSKKKKKKERTETSIQQGFVVVSRIRSCMTRSTLNFNVKNKMRKKIHGDTRALRD